MDNAINKVWPLSEICGGRLHQKESWYRTIKNRAFLKSINKKQKYVNIFGLPFLNSQSAGNCFSFEL